MKVIFCKTKAGNGFKIAVGDEWLYTSKKDLLKVLNDEVISCRFSSIKKSSEVVFEDIFDNDSDDDRAEEGD